MHETSLACTVYIQHDPPKETTVECG